MKYIFILVAFLLTNHCYSQIKVAALPTTTVGATGDFLIKDDAAGTPGSTKKISVLNFVKTYSATISSVVKFDSAHCWTKLKTDTVVGCSPLVLKGDTIIFKGDVKLRTPYDFFMNPAGTGTTLFRYGVSGSTIYNVLRFGTGGLSLFSKPSSGAYLCQLDVTPTTLLVSSSYSLFASMTFDKNYHNNYIDLSAVDKKYVDSIVPVLAPSVWKTAVSPTTAITYTVGSVGIGTSTISATLDLVGAGTTSTTTTFEANNASNVNLFKVRDDGYISAGANTAQSLTIGRNSGYDNSITGNLFVGMNIAPTITTGGFNTVFGNGAMAVATSIQQATAIGSGALASVTTSGSSYMTAVGFEALNANSGGTNCTAVGFGALRSNNGNVNAAFGTHAGYVSTGSNNAFFGSECFFSIVGGGQNAGMGAECFKNKSSGDYNTGMGYAAGLNSTSGSNSTYIGGLAGLSCTGSNNVFLGYYAGEHQTSTASKLIIGNQDYTTEASELAKSMVVGTFGADSSTQKFVTNSEITFTNGVGRGMELHAISTPTTAATITLTKNQFTAVNPAGTIAALTIIFPSTPSNNDFIIVKFEQIVTTVTYVAGTGGATIKGQVNGVLGGLNKWVYDLGTNTWY